MIDDGNDTPKLGDIVRALGLITHTTPKHKAIKKGTYGYVTSVYHDDTAHVCWLPRKRGSFVARVPLAAIGLVTKHAEMLTPETT